jgi:crotonobetainyl-CoA:carnitine CoA-transferase CaiB-like acyl-CoA transferase
MPDTIGPQNTSLFTRYLTAFWQGIGGAPGALAQIEITGSGNLPSVFPVSDFASAAVGTAGLALAELVAAHQGTRHSIRPCVTVDRRLASFWFHLSLRPQGWELPPAWDSIAGDYAATDGWIRLHTNAPHHRQAVLSVLGLTGEPDEAAVTRIVAGWQVDDLESAVVAAGGCAATMRSRTAWAEHPQGRVVAAAPLVHQQEAGDGPVPNWRPAVDRRLAGIRVLDLTRILAGPVATRFLAGYGAEVLRIDPPGWDEPSLAPEVTLGKHCAKLDLRVAVGRDRFERLLAAADILVHGYRADALAGLGLDAARRREINPQLIDISLDAYGWNGPWQNRRGFDSLVQMSAGIAEAGMRRLGRDRPTPLPVQALDHAAGYLLAACALRGLSLRQQRGRGSEMRTSLARMAHLLTSLEDGSVDDSLLSPQTIEDLAPVLEATAWGPARRLQPPLIVADAPMQWSQPAGKLGATEAMWM